MRTRILAATAAVAASLVSACGSGRAPTPAALRIGALFPLAGSQGPLAREEWGGVQVARDLVNADGGVSGREVELDLRDLESRESAGPAVASLADDGVPAIIGAYSSQLSMPASSAAASRGLVYWEAGAVVDRLTGRGLAGVFRVGATGGNLGQNAGRFAVEQLAPRLGRTPRELRAAVVYEHDPYGDSVADAAMSTLRAAGARLVASVRYSAYSPDWDRVLGDVRTAHPDVLLLASYIPDGVGFRRAMLAAHLRVGALIGSTMAECGPEFGAQLGADAIGVFASDRPMGNFNPGALNATGLADYDRFAAAWHARTGRAPSEEALAGFSAAWALFHDVLPRAATAGRLDAGGIAAAARATVLAEGTLPNGAGLQFAGDASRMGQNLRAAAVIWQWQSVRSSVVVWPAEYATGTPRLVPLPA